MQAVEAAIGELTKAASEGKRDKRNQAIIGRIADYLLLLVGCHLRDLLSNLISVDHII
jgi:hypothetical protein